MSQLFWKAAFTLVVLFFAAVMLIRAQPDSAAELRGFLTPPEGCPAPCFLGIRPGLTTVDEAAALLERHGWAFHPAVNEWSAPRPVAQGVTPILSLTRGGEVVTHVTLSGLRLGDIQLALGQPSRIILYNSVAQGAKPYDMIYSGYSLYVLVDLYICDLSQSALWNDPRPVSVHVANTLVNRYEVNPNFFISADELDLRTWAKQLRNLNSCKGEIRS